MRVCARAGGECFRRYRVFSEKQQERLVRLFLAQPPRARTAFVQPADKTPDPRLDFPPAAQRCPGSAKAVEAALTKLCRGVSGVRDLGPGVRVEGLGFERGWVSLAGRSLERVSVGIRIQGLGFRIQEICWYICAGTNVYACMSM